jgi:hypothetical protein
MGSFSWMYATPNPTKSSPLNIMYGDKVKLLIPEALGGGAIVGTYRDYGDIETADGTLHDVYELVTLWNSPTLRNILKEHNPELTDADIARKSYNKDADEETNRLIRRIGIDWNYGTYGDRLFYGLKFARLKDKVTYETCDYFSSSDPWQGFRRASFASSRYWNWGEDAWANRVEAKADENLGKEFVEPKVHDLNELVRLRSILKGK